MMSTTDKRLPIIEQDQWLLPVEDEINLRHRIFEEKLETITAQCGSIVDYANGYLYFGWQYDDALAGWWFREWLPGAIDVFILGDFNGWQRTQLRLDKDRNGVWSIFFPDSMYADKLTHGSLYKIHVHGQNGWLDRIPAYATRVVQNDTTKDFTAQFWINRPFDWSTDTFDISACKPLLIYETHIGMAQERKGVGTYTEFADNILPVVKRDGYNAIQIMAIAEHPYYGSFGYHVSSFFAPSSRFGTPEELKSLIRKAHSMGIGVIMDIVHAHYVKNINEGINELDGTPDLYSRNDESGYHKYWDSKIFDYGKPEVCHFLLSNIKYWLDEFHFDGFRFDGITSMIYSHHGYTEFSSRDKFFNDEVNRDALSYLTLANTLVHSFRKSAITIAEDVSGMPGMCVPAKDGGIGFDYRLGMALPDFWIKQLKDIPDEDWDINEIWSVMTNRLPYVKTVAYAESHDQALVGDKTLAFRLMDKDMYFSMNLDSKNLIIERGIALHKMIRLMTISTGGEAYLNFMGNEFGHPEWIDFPRAENNWSYEHARRQWSLSRDIHLRYKQLGDFDKAMLGFVKRYNILSDGYPYLWQSDALNKTLVFSHKRMLFVFNWHPQTSVSDYITQVPYPGKYIMELSTDEKRFGGFGREDKGTEHFSFSETDSEGTVRHYIRIYNTSRTATIFKWKR